MYKPIPWNIKDLMDATGGDLVCGSGAILFQGVSIDSRSIASTDLYLALRGQNHDGHAFIADAAQKGCRGFIVNRNKAATLSLAAEKDDPPVAIAVEDTVKTLGQLSRFQRLRAKASVVAITGSNGKTTTKELTKTVLEQKFVTHATAGNFNNEIGLPLTLLQLSDQHQWAVVELGMNHPGEILNLAHICQPDIGVITNIGPAHIEGVGSIEGVMAAKGELLAEMTKSQTAILNADDARVLQLAKTTAAGIILYGTSGQAEVRAENVTLDGFGHSFTLVLPTGKIAVTLSLPGEFMITNALAAAAVSASIKA